MSQQQHTQEPWKTFTAYAHPEIRDADDQFIASLSSGDTINARRIVACVNACDGISTGDLERYYNTGGGIDEALQEASLRSHVRAVQQRDELLAALEKAKPALEMYRAYGWDDRSGVIREVDAAIASVKEQS